MIPARKQRRFEAWFAGQAEKRLASTFGAVHVRGLDATRALEGPLVLVANHVAWWDPLVILVASTAWLRRDAYALMDAGNLAAKPFFGLVGAFGVDRSDPRDGARALRHAAKLLRGPERAVWIFPQGREVPDGRRPLGFEAGAATLERLVPAVRCVPVAIRYAFLGEEKPVVLVAFGPPLAPADGDVEARAQAQDQAVVAELDRIDRALTAPDDLAAAGFATTRLGRPSRLDAVLEAILTAFVHVYLRLTAPPGRGALPAGRGDDGPAT